MKKLLILTIVTSIIILAEAKDAIRWCRSRARSCSRIKFTKFVDAKLDALEKAKKKDSDGGKCAPDAPRTPPGTGDCACPAGEEPDAAEPTKCKAAAAAGARRRKRDVDCTADANKDSPDCAECKDPANADTPKCKGGGGEPGGEAGGPTLPTTTTEKPSLTLPPAKVFVEADLETTFFECLDALGVNQCRIYMTQRCNWYDGKSSVISGFCKKWGIACKSCGK